jgi:acyl-CoA synthetase (AMP-forming)/AMP-acid ligase II
MVRSFSLATLSVPLNRFVGLTESTAVAACQTVEESERFPGSTGTLYPTLEARLLDSDLNDAAPGEAGELCLRGATVMK